MAYIITSDCICCGACVTECPASAISVIDGQYVISEEECLDCGLCFGTCPNNAIKENN